MTSSAALRRILLFSFSLPAMMQGFMHAPESLVQGIYAKHAGLTLAAMATAVLCTRIFDIFTYPLIGYLSDATYRRFGTRKPWILAGTAVTVTGLWFLYRPSANVTAVWFGAWTLVTYIGWKLTEIPYGAWSYELSGDYVQRARIQLWRSMASLAGNLFFYLVPYLAQSTGLSQTTELNLQSLALAAILIAAIVPLANVWCLLRVPDGEAPAPTPDTQHQKRESMGSVLRSVYCNGPLVRLMLAFVPITVFVGMSTAVTYLFMDSYLGISEMLPRVLLVAAPFSMIGLPFWGWICLRFERHRVWSVSLILGSFAYAGQAFIAPGQDALVPLMVMYPLGVLALVALGVTVPAMLGDVVDYGKLEFGEDRAGLYYAAFTFLLKSLGGISAAAGLALVGWLGFDATASAQSVGGVLGIRLVAAILPAAGMIYGAALSWNFPITRARQMEIQAQLKALECIEAH